ncbi:MAG: hypothetical protein AABY05_02330 [Nanoarchaeota archaeon]
MGEMKISITDGVEEIFRKIAMKRFGYRKGAFSMAAEEAINNWTFSSIEEEKLDDPVNAIAGLMKHVKKNSVELQHETGNILGEKYVNRRKHFS